MKKIITLSTIAFLSTSLYAEVDMQAKLDAMMAKMEQMESKIEKLETEKAASSAVPSTPYKSVSSMDAQDKKITALETKLAKVEKKQAKQQIKISKVNAQSSKDNLKFDVDFRTAYDNIQYKTVNGDKFGNDALYSMRLWLGMGYAPEDTNMVFKGQLSVNKAFGASYGQRATGHGFDTFDWVRNEQLTDDSVHLREAYWLWTPTVAGLPLTLSVGRRPATNGYLANLREDDKAKSPLGHVINMEFDGASVGVKLDNVLPGMKFKVCAGRGLTNAASWASQATMAASGGQLGTNLPSYADDKDNLDNTDMLGFIFTPYDDGQYAIQTTYYRGFDVPGLYATTIDYSTGSPLSTMEMKTGGDMDGGAISLKVEGIGNEINDFLDETILFASFAMSKSLPGDVTRTIKGTGTPMDGVYNAGMIGSTDSETGHSIWVGAQMPNLTGGKFGLEYNHGSQNWKAFTYGEDTLVGSKLAVRGSAYEAYWTQPIIDKVFSMQVRYTYLDYDYTGSCGFFGDGSTSYAIDSAQAKSMDAIKTAQDIRVYLRYRY